MPRPIPNELQETIARGYRQLLATGAKRREGQRTMIAEVARTVANARRGDEAACGDRLLAMEAGTGTGKTYAYALGGIPVALAAGLKVVITTATVQLQEQVLRKDLVALAPLLPEVKPVLVKGRSRYVCGTRLDAVADGEGMGKSEPVRGLAYGLKRALSRGEWTGDIDDLPRAPDPSAWAALTNDRMGCAGRRCPKFDTCPFYRARAAIEGANVLVTNHDLLVADSVAGNFILPDTRDSVLIVDEAHELPEKGLAALKASAGIDAGRRWTERAMTVMGAVRAKLGRGEMAHEAIGAWQALERLATGIENAGEALRRSGKVTDVRDPERPWRFEMGRLPDGLAEAAGECAAGAREAHARIKAVSEMLIADDDLPDTQRVRLLDSVGAICGRIGTLDDLWGLMAAHEHAGRPVAKWVEMQADAGELKLCASPIAAGETLHRLLWSRCAASVHVSATLTTTAGFGSHLEASGLGLTAGVRTINVPSPFDYQNQATLVLTRKMPSPKNAEKHTGALIAMVTRQLDALPDGSGALVIFASHAQLRAVRAALPERLAGMVLAQGEGASKREMLSAHMAAIEAGRRSAIFGCASWEQGVDIPGKACEVVIVAKLQFAVPTDPMQEAVREYLESAGKRFFDEVAVPEACRRLAQAAGRLIRSESDTGKIVVADVRLATTAYGKSMLKALPPYRIQMHDEPAAPEESRTPPEPQTGDAAGIQPLPW